MHVSAEISWMAKSWSSCRLSGANCLATFLRHHLENNQFSFPLFYMFFIHHHPTFHHLFSSLLINCRDQHSTINTLFIHSIVNCVWPCFLLSASKMVFPVIGYHPKILSSSRFAWLMAKVARGSPTSVGYWVRAMIIIVLILSSPFSLGYLSICVSGVTNSKGAVRYSPYSGIKPVLYTKK